MKKIFCCVFFLGIIFSLVSCDSSVLWSDDSYEVFWIDAESNIALHRKIESGTSIGRVDAKVVAVGSNKEFVVAKREDLQTGLVSYFYIEKSKDSNYLNQEEITQGPFTESSYAELKEQLNLPDFDRSF